MKETDAGGRSQRMDEKENEKAGKDWQRTRGQKLGAQKSSSESQNMSQKMSN